MSEKIWEEKDSRRGSYTISIPGNWQVWKHKNGTLTVGVDDCGCCGYIDLVDVATFEQFNSEWERLGNMMRPHVQRALNDNERKTHEEG